MDNAPRIYEIISAVVAFSAVVQGATVPWLAGRLEIPLRAAPPQPWSLGIRLRHEPEGIHRFAVAPGAAADGAPIGELELAHGARVSLNIRSGRLIPVEADATLRPGDEVVVLAGDAQTARPGAFFAGPRPVLADAGRHRP